MTPAGSRGQRHSPAPRWREMEERDEAFWAVPCACGGSRHRRLQQGWRHGLRRAPARRLGAAQVARGLCRKADRGRRKRRRGAAVPRRSHFPLRSEMTPTPADDAGETMPQDVIDARKAVDAAYDRVRLIGATNI